ncbi:MAG TPA: right-handed parallel beta-helix repeat-containing protein [Spirochaetota bacterium]|nr:right-handed parallel beta-helix repeat-containing protein [Spirochaetota bacterium]
MMKLIAQYKRTFLLLAFATAVTTGSCGGENYWSELKGGSSSGTLPPSFPVGMYVSTTGSDVTGDGSPDNPYATIQNGTTQAASNGLHAVFVEAGTYSIPAEITLIEGISLYGGFRPGDWNDRSVTPAARDTGSPYCTEIIYTAAPAIRGTGPISSATVVEGFVIFGPTAFSNENNSNPRISNNTIVGTDIGTSYGIHNLNSSPNIQFNIIIGASFIAVNAYGIYNSTGATPTITANTIYGSLVTSSDTANGVCNTNASTDPIIAGNTIYGGPAANTSRGIYNTNGAEPVIIGNRIASDSATASYAIHNEDCINVVLNGNDIFPGNGSASSVGVYCSNSPIWILNNAVRAGGGATTDYSFGIRLAANSDASIFNNTIDGGTADTGSYGIRIFNAAPLIRNNIIFISGSAPQRVGIVEGNPSNSDPVFFTNNNIFDCPILYHDDDPAGIVDDIVDWNQLNDPLNTTQGGPAQFNISVPLTLDADFRILAPPLVVWEGGADLTGFLDDDKDENPRTVPWSIGAYEYD